MFKIAYINLKRFFKDKKVMSILFLSPIIITILFSTVFPSTDENAINYIEPIKIAVEDKDNSPASKQFLNRLSSDDLISIGYLNDPIGKVKNQKYPLALVITKGLNIEMIKGDTDTFAIVSSKIQRIMSDEVDGTGNEIINPVLKLEIINNYEPQNQANDNLFLGFAINFQMLSMIYIINEINHLKSNRVLIRSYSTPNSGKEIIGGLNLAMFLIIMIQLMIFNIASTILLKQSVIKDFLSLSLFIPFGFLVLSIGVFFSKIIKDSDMAPIVANFFVVPTGMLSGTFVPRKFLPSFLYDLSFITPQYWLFDGLKKVNSGGVVKILPNILLLTLLALCFFTAGVYNFKKLLKT